MQKTTDHPRIVTRNKIPTRRILKFEYHQNPQHPNALSIRIGANIVGPLCGVEVLRVDLVHYGCILRAAWENYVDSGKTKDSLLRLAQTGYKVFNLFMASFVDDREVEQTLRRFFKRMDADTRVEWETRDCFFPLSLLYIKAPNPQHVRMRDFLGLKGLVTYTSLKLRMPERLTRQRANTQVALYSSITLNWNPAEFNTLKALTKNVNGRSLVFCRKRIKTPNAVLDLWSRTVPLDIVHFAAHAKLVFYAGSEVPGIELAPEEYLRPDHFCSPPTSKRQAGKLLFFNCCRTLPDDPLAPSGFIQRIIPGFAEGVILTQTQIEEETARSVAVMFYANLFSGENRNRTVGGALFAAISNLAEDNRDASGLSYCLFNICPDTIFN